MSSVSQSFEVLYDLYADPLYRYIYRFTAQRPAAEDILHDVFAEYLTGKYRAPESAQTESLKAWLYTTAKNKSLNYLKKSAHEKPKSDVIENSIDKNNLELSTIDKNLFQVLSHIEKSLPKDLFDTWQLKKQGYDYENISKELSIPVGTVKSRYHRIVEILRKELV